MIDRNGLLPNMHRSVATDGLVFVGGTIATDLTLGMKGQTEQTLTKIEGLLAAHGTDKSRLLSATIFVTDLSLKGEMNEVWSTWLKPEEMPARATIGISDLGPGILIEITAVAAR